MSQQDERLCAVADHLRVRGLASSAAFLLEALRPLAFVTGQLCHVLAPVFAVWSGESQAVFVDLGVLLSTDPDGVEHLLALLDEEGSRR